MDAAAERALAEMIRQTVASDLDQLHSELAQLRRELTVVARAAGLPASPLGVRERRVRVVELRARGLSTRAIGEMLGAPHSTITHDLMTLGVRAPARVLGMDGRTYQLNGNGHGQRA